MNEMQDFIVTYDELGRVSTVTDLRGMVTELVDFGRVEDAEDVAGEGQSGEGDRFPEAGGGGSVEGAGY